MSDHKQLKVAVVGGLGTMSSPMARHWKNKDAIRVLTVLDRKSVGLEKDRYRKAWLENGAQLVETDEELLAKENIDGVFVCAGKNGDDLPIISTLANNLAKISPGAFICHLSTVSTNFVKAAYQFCQSKNIHYVNYPLTGGSAGAENASMLILASGDLSTYEKLSDSLSLIGKPKFFGNSITAGAEVKLMGQLMVFNGLIGICSAAAVQTESFNEGQLGGEQQADFFDFLNQGAGGTRQWDASLSLGIKKNIWDKSFYLKHAVVDAIYAAQMCIDYKISWLAIEAIINTTLAFSFVINKLGANLATQAIVKEMLSSQAKQLDEYLIKHSAERGDARGAIKKCIQSLPSDIQKTVLLNVESRDFASTN